MQVGRLLLASFREDARWERGCGSATTDVGDVRANQLMPFRLAVWRKLGCFKMTRSSWLLEIIIDVDRLGLVFLLRVECRV